MQTIESLFIHRLDGGNNPIGVTDVRNPNCDWVFETDEQGHWVHGIATKMFDGIPCYVDPRGQLFRRVVIPPGQTPPTTFIPAGPWRAKATTDGDGITRSASWVGWLPVVYKGVGVERLREDGTLTGTKTDVFLAAWTRALTGLGPGARLRTGTYELVGPSIAGNPENMPCDLLVKHGDVTYPHCPRDYWGIKDFIDDMGIHGIVWHMRPGVYLGTNKMAKIRGKDFGLIRTVRQGS